MRCLRESHTATFIEDPWLRVQDAFSTLIDSCAQPEVQRVVFRDAPGIIGPKPSREIELTFDQWAP